jgi:hypothetical protein
MWRVQEALMEVMTARSGPGGYRGQGFLKGTEETAGGEHCLVKPGRRYECYLGESATTVNGTEYEWKRLLWKVG